MTEKIQLDTLSPEEAKDAVKNAISRKVKQGYSDKPLPLNLYEGFGEDLSSKSKTAILLLRMANNTGWEGTLERLLLTNKGLIWDYVHAQCENEARNALEQQHRFGIDLDPPTWVTEGYPWLGPNTISSIKKQPIDKELLTETLKHLRFFDALVQEYNIRFVKKYIYPNVTVPRTDKFYETYVELNKLFEKAIQDELQKVKQQKHTERYNKLQRLRAKKLKESVPKDVYSVITKIEKPIFERTTGNENGNTFDFVRVFINIISESKRRNTVIKENKQEFVKLAISKITTESIFKNACVPINILEPQRMTITKQCTVEILFALRSELVSDSKT